MSSSNRLVTITSSQKHRPSLTGRDDLRITRYYTKSRNIIIRVKHIDKIPVEER